jgi:hypothetical protein
MLLNAFAQTQMENTDHVANPLAIPALAPLGSLGDLFCTVALLGGVLAAVVRHVALLVRTDPAGRRVGRIGLPLALLVVVVFVVQGALTTDTAPLAANLVAGAAFLVAGGAIILAGTRLARTREDA